MKYSIIFLMICFQAYSQNNLLVKSNGLLKIYNYESQKQIVLDSIDHANIAGYNFIQDTLVVSLENQGFINNRKYKMEDKLYNELKSSNQSFQINNFKALYFHSPNNPKTTYSCNNIKITIANGMRIICFINEDEKWSKVITKKVFGGIGASGFGYQNPLISSDSKRILISFTDPKFFKKSEPSLLEIDLETGKILKSIKNASKYAYSGDSNFVLYFDTKRNNYSVYSIKEDSITEFYYFENCFWLVKDYQY